MLAVDTNVLIYAADADSQFHAPCRAIDSSAKGADPMPGTPLGV